MGRVQNYGGIAFTVIAKWDAHLSTSLRARSEAIHLGHGKKDGLPRFARNDRICDKAPYLYGLMIGAYGQHPC